MREPDPDALGSQLGLRDILRTNFPDKKSQQLGLMSRRLPLLARWISWLMRLSKGNLSLWQIRRLHLVLMMRGIRRVIFLIKIDHHPNDDAYGNLLAVDTTASSASEIIANFAFENDLQVSDDAPRVLYGDCWRYGTFSLSSDNTQNALHCQEN